MFTMLDRKCNVFQYFSYVLVPNSGCQFSYHSVVQFKLNPLWNETVTRADTAVFYMEWDEEPPPQGSRAGPCAHRRLHGPHPPQLLQQIPGAASPAQHAELC